MRTLSGFTFLDLGLSLLPRHVAAQTTIGEERRISPTRGLSATTSHLTPVRWHKRTMPLHCVFDGLSGTPSCGIAEKMTASTSWIWITSGKFAGDCNSASDSCDIATKCSDETIYFGGGSSTSWYDCLFEPTRSVPGYLTLSLPNSGTFSCVSMTIFQTSPDGLPSATNIECRQGWRAYTVYRELEVSSTDSGESSRKA